MALTEMRLKAEVEEKWLWSRMKNMLLFQNACPRTTMVVAAYVSRILSIGLDLLCASMSSELCYYHISMSDGYL